MRRSRVIGRIVVFSVLVLPGIGGGIAEAQPIATPPDCSSAYNPYDYTQVALSACGVTTSTQTTTTALSGGGTEYNYTLPNGEGVAHIIVPPTGFDPTTATAAQLAEYGLPAAPTSEGVAAVENWEAFISTLKNPQPAPAFLAYGTASADTVSNSHWSGYAANPSGTTFTSSISYWDEPNYGSSYCAENSAVIWTGLGGYSDDDLGQDGTAWSSEGQIGLADHQAWWEVLPQVTSIVPLDLIIPGGDEAGALTDWAGTEYAGIMEDETTGDYTVWTYPTTDFSGSSGEAIAERPLYSTGFGDLSNFGTLSFVGAYENYLGMNEFSSTGGRHGIWMYDSAGNLMAEPSGVGTNGAFTDTQKDCQ